MNPLQKLALSTAIVAGATAMIFSSPVDAQRAAAASQESQRAKAKQSALTINGRNLDASVRAGADVAAQDAALAAAQAAARSPDAQYAVGLYQLQLAQSRQDVAMRSRALDVLIANSVTPPTDRANYLSVQAGAAFQARDYARARALYTQVLELRPNDPAILANLAQVQLASNDRSGGVTALQQAIAASVAAGRPVPEEMRHQAMVAAYEARQVAPTIELGQALVTAHPTPRNWRDALIAYRQVSTLDDPGRIETLRLMRAAGVLKEASEYQQLAQLLDQAGLPGEAKAVLDEGVSRQILSVATPRIRDIAALVGRNVATNQAGLTAAQRTALAARTGTSAFQVAETLSGYGRHADAIPLYRAALQKGSVDAGAVHTRLGVALALAGQRAEAEAAFRAVTGSRAGLAGYWLLWLAQRR
jgi:tetratricopeptide (TPR) repeat protein